jgi:tetratricopeptide (TPR) repeat protein
MEKALRWAVEGERLHASRCPRNGACVAGWHAVSSVAEVQYRAGRYEEAKATILRCEAIRTAAGQPAYAHGTAAALMAATEFRLGNLESASDKLEEARRLAPDEYSRPYIEEAAALIAGQR